MQLKKGQIVEIEVQALAFGGRGVGDFEGLKVFVDRCMPGDRVAGRLTRIKSNFAEADFVELIRPAAERVAERCEYAGRCGGCQIQFMPYEQQIALKRKNVVDCFERIGKFEAPAVEAILGCEEQFFYRNKMEFSFGYDVEMNFALGLHLPGRRYDILDLKKCYLVEEKAVKILNLVRDFVAARLEEGLVPYQYSSGAGFLRSLFLREGKRTGDFLVNLVTSDDYPKAFEDHLAALSALLKQAGVVTFYHTEVISRRGVKRQDKARCIFGEEFLREKMIVGGRELEFEILPQAFFQVNTLQAEVLYNQVLNFAGEKRLNLVFDLFCGTGTIGMFLAGRAENVVGIELNSEAVASARQNAARNGIKNIEFFEGDVGKVLAELERKSDLVVVDPPRAGLTPEMVEEVLATGAARLIYVSCNPATLARDAALFRDAGFELKSVVPVDMFPQTFHVEVVALMENL